MSLKDSLELSNLVLILVKKTLIGVDLETQSIEREKSESDLGCEAIILYFSSVVSLIF